MRILYHHRLASKDGQLVHVDELVAALRRRGHDVTVLAPPLYEERPFGAAGGIVDRLKRLLPAALYELLELGYGLLAALRLLLAVRRVRPDLVYERYSLHTPAGALARFATGVPYLLEVNAPLAEERARFDGLALPRLARAVERRIWRAADRVLVVTAVLAERVRAAGIASERIVVTPNGVDLDRLEAAADRERARRALGIGCELVLGFVGFVKPWHGLDPVLDWLARPERSNALLLVAGEGPHAPVLRRRAAELGIEARVRFLGVVPRERVPDVVRSFDIALQPAVVDYASPLKLVEYMALGRAILAPDRPNIREILTHGRNAWLVAPEGLLAGLDRLADDPALRARLGAAARATVLERDLTWDANARRVETLAAELGISKAAARGSLDEVVPGAR
ncbi:MAG: glycosyltransferase family 4 protein [Geminicoccaceae bacterium]|nr:glycosyltransferase family 4 protein [Geminicoccaceae bacterium]